MIECGKLIRHQLSVKTESLVDKGKQKEFALTFPLFKTFKPFFAELMEQIPASLPSRYYSSIL